MPTPLAEIKNVSCVFGKKKVLDDVSLKFEAGKFYALTGVNGAGKSTLMNFLAGNLFPQMGEVSFFGEPVGSDCGKIFAKTLYVSEKMTFDLAQSVDQIAADYSKFYKKWNGAIWSEWKDYFKIDASQVPQTFSRGQNMQIALGMQMAIQPELLLVDEITAVLDSYARDYVLKKLKSESDKGNTVVMATNLLNDLNTGVSDMILLHDSKIACQMQTHNIQNHFVKVRLNKDQSMELLQGLKSIQVSQNSDYSRSFLIPVDELKNKANETLIRTHLDQRGITPEEVFKYYTHSRMN